MTSETGLDLPSLTHAKLLSERIRILCMMGLFAAFVLLGLFRVVVPWNDKPSSPTRCRAEVSDPGSELAVRPSNDVVLGLPIHFTRRHPDSFALRAVWPLWRSYTACISSTVSKYPTMWAALNDSPALVGRP